MALIRRTAKLSWEGTLARGAGFITAKSGAFDRLPVTDASRMTLEGEVTKTSPEELLAGAHATCFAMALGAGLAGARTPPTSLEVEATYTQALAMVLEPAANCVVSKAVAGNVAVSVRAELVTD